MNANADPRPLTRCVGGLLVFLILAAPAALAAEPATLELVQTIPLKGVEGRLDHLAIDAKGKRLFVANLSNNSLDVVDLDAGKLVKQVPKQKKIQGIAYVPDLDRIFVGNGDDGVCNVFDGRTYELVKSLEFAGADNVRFDPRTNQVYVGHTKFLSAIDAKSLKVKEIKLPGAGKAFQLHPSKARLYVNTHEPAQVVEIDTEKNEVVGKFPVKLAEGNYALALDAEGGRLYVGCRKKPAVVVLDMKGGKEIGSVAIPQEVDDLFFDAKRKRLYASCGEGVLAVVAVKDKDTLEVAERITTKKLARTCLFDAGTDRLYLAVPRQKDKDGPEIWVYRPRK
jgi:DNA-binding beta-propeller fold protein YncE